MAAHGAAEFSDEGVVGEAYLYTRLARELSLF